MVRSKSVRSWGWVLLLALLSGMFPTKSQGAPALASPFPVRLSANNRYLLDSTGSPFFVVGDSPWYLFQQLTKAEAEEYLENRRTKGFNTIIAEMMVANNVNQPFFTRDGDAPFTTPNDFGTPNPNYFAHVDYVLTKAAEKGILVFLAPTWFGSGMSDWWNAIVQNGPTKCRTFGQYLGNRYRNFNNIIWVHGGDFSAPPNSAGETNALQILLGMKDVDGTKLHTMHRARFSTALQQTNFAPYFDLDATYSGDLTYQESLVAYNRSSFRPSCLIEGRYEGMQNWDSKYNPPELVRYGAYGCVLSGSTGQIFGSMYILDFGYSGLDWRAGMERQGSFDMVRLKTLFGSRPWYRLVPDQSHTVVTGGYGSNGGYDYVTAARVSDGSLVMAYVPSTGTGSRTITVDLGRLAGSTTARWFNPTTGVYTTISGSPFGNSGNQPFTTPGNNGTGTNDWVLVLEAAASSGSFALSASPGPVQIGGSATASWTAPAGQASAKDWIGLYASGVADNVFTSWQYTGGALSGSLSFPAPATPGTYEFRYFLNDGWVRVATSNSFAVTSGSGGSGLLGLWKLDEGSGSTTEDASGNGNSGSLINGPTWTTGKSGAALSFDGLNDYVQIPASASLNSVTTSLTIAAWVFRSASQSGYCAIANRQKGTGNYEYYFLGFFNDRPDLWLDTSPTTGAELLAPSATPIGSWFHVAATADAAGMKLYVNGVQVASASRSGSAFPSDSSPLTLGTSLGGGNLEPLGGRLDDVRLYNRALSASEVQGLVGSGSFSVTIDYVSTGRPTSLATVQSGLPYYTDRAYTMSSASSALNGQKLIRTANDDKTVTAATHLKFSVGQPATVYVCYDPRAGQAPSWLSSWTLTGETFVVADGSGPLSMRAYAKAVPAGQVTLGGNLASGAVGALTNYVVIVKP